MNQKINNLDGIYKLLDDGIINAHEFAEFKAKILSADPAIKNGSVIKMEVGIPKNTISIRGERLIAAGLCVKSIFSCIVWQIIVGILYVTLINNPPWFNYRSIVEILAFQGKINIAFAVIELIIVVVFLINLWGIGNHLVKVHSAWIDSPDSQHIEKGEPNPEQISSKLKFGIV